MAACAECGYESEGGPELCSYHVWNANENWARSNKIMCDFFHRRIVPTRHPDENLDLQRKLQIQAMLRVEQWRQRVLGC